MKIIDVHAHIFPPKIVQIATEAIGDFYGYPMRYMGSAEELLSAGARANVSNFVVFSTATTPAQVVKINDFILDSCAAHPEFIGLGTMHPEYSDFAAELDRIYAGGMRGIKLHPDFQKFYIDCDELMPIFAHLQSRGMFLITHAGDPRHHFSDPRRIARVAKAFPKLNIIAAHFGGWSDWQTAREVLAELPNVYYDTSSTYGYGGIEPMIEGFKTFDNTHIFFGADFPMGDHSEEIEVLRKLLPDDETFENVLGRNFERFMEMYK